MNALVPFTYVSEVHAPVRGRGLKLMKRGRDIEVSIHAPVTGAIETAVQEVAQTVPASFNPRPREGATPVKHALDPAPPVEGFNPRPREGATRLKHNAVLKEPNGVSIHAPVRGRGLKRL